MNTQLQFTKEQGITVVYRVYEDGSEAKLGLIEGNRPPYTEYIFFHGNNADITRLTAVELRHIANYLDEVNGGLHQ